MRMSDWCSDVCSSALCVPNKYPLNATDRVGCLFRVTRTPPHGLNYMLLLRRLTPLAGKHFFKPRPFMSSAFRMYNAILFTVRPNETYRSEERRVWERCVLPSRSRWAP